MKKTLTKSLSLLLALVLTLSLFPASAFAVETDAPDETAVSDTDTEDASAGEETAEEPAAEEEAVAEEQTADAEETPVEETPAEEPAAEEPAADEQTANEEETAEEPSDQSEEEEIKVLSDVTAEVEYKIVHLDCGRKYFSKKWIIALLYEMQADGYNQLQLAFGNDGLRFLLNDMSFTANGTTYSNDAVVSAVKAGNKTQNSSGDESYLTQTEMDEIISTAKELGIEIVPLLNLPGHANALLDIAGDAYNYSTSSNTLDVTNESAVNFAMAIFQKYVDYFADKGCKFFNFGADEFANDILTNSFAGLDESGYNSFVSFINKLASYIKDKGMTPRAFNDGLYYGTYTSVSIDKNIQCCYWSSGWSGYSVASASAIAAKGHAMINTNGDYYYVLGKSDQFDSDYSYASNFNNTAFMSSTIKAPVGSMFCIWCDYPNAETETDIASNVRLTLRAMAARMNNENISSISTDVVTNGFNAEGTINSASGKEEVTLQQNGAAISGTIALTKGGSTTLSLSDSEAAATWTSSNEDVVTVTAVSADGVNAVTAVTSANAVTVAAVGVGEAVVTATLSDNTALTANVTVTAAGNETITLTVDETTTETQEGVNNQDKVDTTNLNEDVAKVEVDGTDAKEGSVTYSRDYRVYYDDLVDSNADHAETSYYYTPDNGTNYYPVYVTREKNGSRYNYTFYYSKDGGNTYEYIAQETNKRTYNSTNQTLYVVSAKTDPVAASTTITFTAVYPGTTYVKVGDTTYKIVVEPKQVDVQLYENGEAYTVSNVTGSITAEPDSKVATAVLSGGTLTISPVAEGETTATVGDTVYNIKVSKEDLSNVTPLAVEYWITNAQITINSSTSASISASTDGVNSEDGISADSIAPATTTKDGRTIEYWRCRLLDTTKSNSSTSGTERQTTTAGDDETFDGVGFTKIRYWKGNWQVCTENSEWVTVKSTDQLVAYYMEVLDIANSNGNSELHVNAADWGKKGDGSVYKDIYLSPSTSCTVSIQVVYEDGTTNPSDTTAGNLDSKTFVYGYWSSGRGIGTITLTGMDGYEIWKVSAETGSHEYSSNGDYYPYYVNSFSWDKNEKTVWENSENPVESYTIHNDARNPSSDSYYSNLMWDENHESILIRVYVKAKVTDDSLTVHYIDDTADFEFYKYNITVESGTLFNEGFALENGALVNNTVKNSNGQTQTVQSDLSKMTQIGDQYRYSNYQCVKVERSKDGKEVYLHYTFNNTKSYVIDFGLPLTITQKDLGISGSGWGVTGAKYGTAKVDSDKGTLTYTPTTTLKDVEALTLTLTLDSGSTIGYQIYIYPATTVYYEEGFATYSSGWASTGSKGSSAQTTSAVVENDDDDLYGYDAAYSGSVSASNSSEAVSSVSSNDRAEFTFTGTGVDIYANCTTVTGTAMIAIRKDNSSGSLVKLITVDTKMADGTTTLTDGQAVTAYNVPIVSLTGLDHGTYYVSVAHVKSGSTETSRTDGLRLDGFRVYNTLGTNTAAQTIYGYDMEDNPSFTQVRDLTLATIGMGSYSGEYGSGASVVSQVYSAVSRTEATAVVIDSKSSYTDDELKDLVDNGPKNEIYLASGQTLVLTVNTSREVQLGLKALNAATSYTVNGGSEVTLNASTDMFYQVAQASGGTITITNKGAGILSVTQLKICDAPSDAVQPVSEESIRTALTQLGYVESTDPEPTPEPTYADAQLNITVAVGSETLTTGLTKNGVSGESATFTADEIQAAVEALTLPEGYVLGEQSYSDVTVAYGESGEAAFTAEEETVDPEPTPDPDPEPDPEPEKPASVWSKVKDFFKKLFRW